MITSATRTALVALSALTAISVHAQDPTSVDIDLRRSTVDTNNLEVRIRANDQSFGDVVSGLTFTIRWATTSPATLGISVSNCPNAIGIAPTEQVTNPSVDDVPTGYNYRTYNAFGFTLLSDWNCTLSMNTWRTVMSVPVEGNIGCTTFDIVNDVYTHSPGNARDYFVSLGGIDKTGIIEPTSAVFGACLPDCEGVVGGSALPGSPCDDQDPDTEGDTYNEQCVCAGLPMGQQEITRDHLMMSLLPNPTANGAFLLHMEGIPSTDARVATIDVLDALGRRVTSARANITAGTVHQRMDLSAVAGTGLYLVRATIDGHAYTQRLVIR